MPKLQSPFARETINGEYIVTPKIAEGYEWVFTDKPVWAVDKLDGTNICIRVENGQIAHIFNRTTEKFLWKITGVTAWEGACLEGIAKCIQKGWGKYLTEGDNFGELIGPIINGNRHGLDYHLYVPFAYLKQKCHWNSFIGNDHEKNYKSISEWFQHALPSLFNQRLGLPKIDAEGLVFYHEDGRMAKLRRDMFDWYEGERHQ